MDSKKSGSGKPAIDKEYLKKLAEKIKAEKAKKEAGKTMRTGQATSAPPKPPAPSIPPTLLDDDDEDEEMAAEKTAIIDLASLSGHSSDTKLTILDGKDEGKSIDIARDEIFCGRSLDNDFVISDISVSRKHFKIVKEGDAYSAVDMGSGNGIRVNGKKEAKIVLMQGDLITAGARTIRFDILNEDLKEKYSRKVEIDTDEIVVKTKTSPVVIAMMIILFTVIGVGGYLLYEETTKPKGLSPQEEFEFNTLKLGKAITEMKNPSLNYADKKGKILEAQSLLYKLLAQKQNSKELNDKNNKVQKEKGNAQKFELASKQYELAKQENIDEKVKAAELKFREVPEDSVFFGDIIRLLTKEKVFGWLLEDAKKLVTEKKIDAALVKLNVVLDSDPLNEDARNLKAELEKSVGKEKVASIKKKMDEKKAAEKKAEILEKKKFDALQAKKDKAAGKKKIAKKRTPQRKKKRKPRKRKVAKKRKPIKDPFESDGGSFKKSDIKTAVALYLKKDFDSAIDKLKEISDGSSGSLKKSANKTRLDIKKFKKAWNKAENADGAKKKKHLKKCIKYDKAISKGKFKKELNALLKGSKKTTKKTAKKAGKNNPKKAKKLYMEARSLRDSDPESAREKFEKVLDLIPEGSKYFKKAKKSLRKL